MKDLNPSMVLRDFTKRAKDQSREALVRWAMMSAYADAAAECIRLADERKSEDCEDCADTVSRRGDSVCCGEGAL